VYDNASSIIARYISMDFAGLRCIGTLPYPGYKDGTSRIEIYELPEEIRKDFVAAWYPDGAMQGWPRFWLDNMLDRFDPNPPARPRNRISRSRTKLRRLGGTNRALLKRHRVKRRT
jgi:hypothetical protein